MRAVDSDLKQYLGAAQLECSGRNERKDIQRKYMCSGKDTILQHEEPSSSSVPSKGVASITQLSYSMFTRHHSAYQLLQCLKRIQSHPAESRSSHGQHCCK